MNMLRADIVLCLLGLVLCLPGFFRAPRRRFALAGCGFWLAYLLVPDVGWFLPRWPWLPGHYDWGSKLLELLVDLVALAWLLGPANWSRQELGLTFRLAPGTGQAMLAFLLPVLLLELGVLWHLVAAEQLSWEDHAFQLTAPGLTEELAFRGIWLALLDRAFPGRVRVLGTTLGWGTVVTSLLFGFVHGLAVDSNWRLSWQVAPMAIPLVGGFVLAWCRARSGSLLIPWLVHAGMNEVANFIAALKAVIRAY